MFAMSRAAFAAAKRPTRAALVAAIALTLAACSSGGTSNDADSLTITDTWAKAAETGMTAAFGTITNSSNHDINIVAASSPAATEVQLHEVVDDKMRQVDGGFVIPAGGSLTLQPGGFHLMFMGIPSPIKAGDDVSVTITLSDKSQKTFTAVAKDFTGANESYDGSTMGGDMSMAPSDGMGMSAEPSMSASASMGG
jgi:periplasmic copper chaperone A